MDFFANGYLKSKLVTRRYTTIDGMLRCAKQEWMDIPLEMFRNALSSWSDRVKKIFKAKGRDGELWLSANELELELGTCPTTKLGN